MLEEPLQPPPFSSRSYSRLWLRRRLLAVQQLELGVRAASLSARNPPDGPRKLARQAPLLHPPQVDRVRRAADRQLDVGLVSPPRRLERGRGVVAVGLPLAAVVVPPLPCRIAVSVVRQVRSQQSQRGIFIVTIYIVPRTIYMGTRPDYDI